MIRGRCVFRSRGRRKKLLTIFRMECIYIDERGEGQTGWTGEAKAKHPPPRVRHGRLKMKHEMKNQFGTYYCENHEVDAHWRDHSEECWCLKRIMSYSNMEQVKEKMSQVDFLMITGTKYHLFAVVPNNGCPTEVTEYVIIRDGDPNEQKDNFVRGLDVHCANGHIRWDLPRARRIVEDQFRKMDRSKIAELCYRFDYEMNQ